MSVSGSTTVRVREACSPSAAVSAGFAVPAIPTVPATHALVGLIGTLAINRLHSDVCTRSVRVLWRTALCSVRRP